MITKYSYSDGTIEYTFEPNPNKILHATHGAAVINDRQLLYYFMGKLHHIYGPAVNSYIGSNIVSEIWFFNGIQMNCKTQSEFDIQVLELIKNKKNVNKVKVGLKKFFYINNNLKEE